MKFLVVFVCALAAASAGYVPTFYAGPQHLPVIDHEGVPVDTAEVQHAKATHFAHKVEAHARNGDFVHGVAPAVAFDGHYAHQAYPTTAVLPAAVAGVPLETPEVVAAKANHFAAHAEALARSAHPVYRYRRGVVAPVAYSGYSAYASPFYGGYAHAPAVATYAGHHAYAAHPYTYNAHYY